MLARFLWRLSLCHVGDWPNVLFLPTLHSFLGSSLLTSNCRVPETRFLGEIMTQLRRIAISLFLLGLAMAIPLTDAVAQTAVGGAIVGGAIGGRRGAAVGAVTGAAVGAHRRYWHGHYGHWHGHNFYYWSHGSCWVRSSNGRSHQVSHRYCH